MNPANAREVASALDAYFRRSNIVYNWRRPTDRSLGEIGLLGRIPDGDGADVVRAIKAILRDTWKEQSVDNARWFVRRWGGIARRSDEDIASYIVEFDRGNFPAFKGIASWSKVANIHPRHLSPIYDSRVAQSLDAIQLVECGRVVRRFPIPPPRTVSPNLNTLITHLGGLPSADRTHAYQDYIDVLAAWATLNGNAPDQHALDEMEMKLFAASSTAVTDAVANLGERGG